MGAEEGYFGGQVAAGYDEHSHRPNRALFCLVFTTIFNVTTQDGQVACFENAAAHLRSGGRVVIEAASRSCNGCRSARGFCRGAPTPTRSPTRLEHRWAGWGREPFTALSAAPVSVYVKP